MTGHQRQILIQQNPLVHQANASQFTGLPYNRTAAIISEIERDMNRENEDAESNPESVAQSEFSVNVPGAIPNHLPLSAQDTQTLTASAFVPVHTTYTSNQRARA